MSDLEPFDRQQLKMLLRLVTDRDAEEVLKHESEPVPPQLLAIEKKLRAQIAEPGSRAEIAEDSCRGRCSSDIRDDAVVARESQGPGGDNLGVLIMGPQAQAAVVARAVVEMLQEAGILASMPEEVVNPYDGDAIEQLGNLRSDLRDACVIVQTSGTRGGAHAAADLVFRKDGSW